MLPFLAMLVCCLLGGRVNDRLTKRRGATAGPMRGRGCSMGSGGESSLRAGRRFEESGWQAWYLLAAPERCISLRVHFGR